MELFVPLQVRKAKNMKTITSQFENISIKNRLLKVIELMNGVSVVKSKPQTRTKNGLDKALEDVEAGRIYKAKDVDDLFKQILG